VIIYRKNIDTTKVALTALTREINTTRKISKHSQIAHHCCIVPPEYH